MPMNRTVISSKEFQFSHRINFYFRAMGKTHLIFFGLLLFLASSVHAQRNVKDSLVFAPHLTFNYAYQYPQGDLAERFGDNSNVGFSFGIKTQSNFYLGLHNNYFFGNTVKENGLLSNLLTDGGHIIDNNGQIAELIIQERGWTLGLEAGKIFPFFGPNPNSGLFLKGGVGFMQHKIRIEHQLNEITQLEGDYLKGYDRLTNGLYLSQFVGYHHMSDNRLLNFYVGIEAIEGFTEGRREFNFDTETDNVGARNDILVGVRAGWVLHLYRRNTDNVYFH